MPCTDPTLQSASKQKIAAQDGFQSFPRPLLQILPHGLDTWSWDYTKTAANEWTTVPILLTYESQL